MKSMQLRRIEQKLDDLIAKVDLLFMVIDIRLPETKEEIKQSEIDNPVNQCEDDYYFDPTKFPNIEGNVSEANSHFE